ncbi:MFS transporter [Paenalcaligenes sp. Me131]|uniref:MFS transporter n=1 Tax=Paenalcaligenes sp. Me131 TaxID=3392636 RepID=UPI003D288DDD
MKFLRMRATTVVLMMLCLMYFITYLDRVNVSTAAAGFGEEFNLSKTEIGLVFSAFAYPYLVFQIIGGWVSDKFGARRTLIWCGVIWAVATILTGFAGGLVSLLVARLLLGLGEGATFPAATSAMSRWVSKENRGFAQGITHAFARIGNAVAPAAVVYIMAVYGWRESFYIFGVISLLWVVVWAFVFTEDPAKHPRITAQELAELPPPKKKNTQVPWGPLFRRMLPVSIVYFCYGWTLWLFLSWIPQYFLHSYDLDIKKSALFASSVFFAGVVGDTLGGIVSDRILKKSGNLKKARSYMVSVCMLLTLLSLLPLLFTHNLYVSILCLGAGFFFAEMTIGPMWAIPMDIAPEHSGTASGMMNSGSALAAIISPVLSGYLIDITGNWELPFVGSMVLMGIGVFLAARLQPDNKFHAASADIEHPTATKVGS